MFVVDTCGLCAGFLCEEIFASKELLLLLCHFGISNGDLQICYLNIMVTK